MTAPWGAGALHQRLNAFVKKSLIQQLVFSGSVVCDLYCGRGVDTENWAEAKIGKYVGVDLSSSALEEAKEEWERNEKPFVARFCELNPCMADLEKHLGVEQLSVDVVTCLSHLQDCFASEDMVRQLLKNVASLLKPGGYFFGATPDSSTIWYKYQKAVEGAMKAGSLRANGHLPRVRTELYSISFEDDRFNEYGSRYQLRFADESVPPQSQILVHFPSLIRRAEELGLECVEIQNLTEFYEDYRGPFAEALQKSCGTLVDAKGHPVVDGKSRLSPVAQDVLSLYTTFIFKKPDPRQRERALKRPAAPTPARVDAKKHKKFSPAVPYVALEDRPVKKHRLSASPAVVTSNGSKMQEMHPKQERSSSRPRPEAARSSGKLPKRSGEPKLGSSHLEGPKSNMGSSEARGRTPVAKTESPSLKGSGGHRIGSPSAKPSEGPSNDSGEGLQPGEKVPEPVKRKRVSRWSSEYVPKFVSLSAGHSTQRKDEGITSQHSNHGVAEKKASGTPAKPQTEPDTVSRFPSSVREAHLVSGACQQLRDGAPSASDGKPQHEPREEGEVAAEDPARGFASPNREKRGVLSERITESIGSEAQVNESQPRENSTERDRKTLTPGKRQPDDMTNQLVKKERANPKPRKKEIAMDVWSERTSTAELPPEHAGMKKNYSDPELAGGSDPDMDLERSSGGETGFSKRDSDGALEPSFSDRRERRELEPAWETKPQRYALRRAVSTSEGGVENHPAWSRSAVPPKMDREHPGFHPRMAYANPVAGFGAGLRAPLRGEERRVAPPPLPGTFGAGLLGAAPSPVFGDRGPPADYRFDMMAPPEVFPLSPNELCVPRPNLRGSFYPNDRPLPRGPEFVGEASNGLAAPWDDHFHGEGCSRLNR